MKFERDPVEGIRRTSSRTVHHPRQPTTAPPAGRARGRNSLPMLGVANEEADETVFWLEHLAGTALGSGFNPQPLQSEARELRAIIARSYATAKRRNRGTN